MFWVVLFQAKQTPPDGYYSPVGLVDFYLLLWNISQLLNFLH